MPTVLRTKTLVFGPGQSAEDMLGLQWLRLFSTGKKNMPKTTDRFGEDLLGRPIVDAYDFRIKVWWKIRVFLSSNFFQIIFKSQKTAFRHLEEKFARWVPLKRNNLRWTGIRSSYPGGRHTPSRFVLPNDTPLGGLAKESCLCLTGPVVCGNIIAGREKEKRNLCYEWTKGNFFL